MNGQKFLAELLKKSSDVNFPEPVFNESNSPPVINTLIRIVASESKIIPENREDTTKCRFLPKSPITSTLIPSISFSMTILFPNAAFRLALNGTVRKETMINEITQKIIIPFHALRDLKKPDFIDSSIFIVINLK